MKVAMTREISGAMERCELTHLERRPIDLALARRQHRAYEETLESLGCRVVRLPEEPELPDSVFVEDVAVVVEEAAVITRPGADSRKPEAESVAAGLREYRELRRIEAPGTLDGGDVMRLGRRIFVGLSRRSNREGIAQLGRLLAPFGYEVIAVPIERCLHLKSAVTPVAEETILINPRWLDPAPFGRVEIVEVDPAEPGGANALAVEGAVLHPDAYPRTAERMTRLRLEVRPVGVSEILKAEGGVTCCSLVFAV